MIQLIDGMLVINLHLISIFLRANLLELSVLALIIVLWTFGRDR